MIFVIPGVVTISLKMIFASLSESDKTIMVEFPSADERHYLENIWDVIVLIAVACVFVILILQMPVFDIEQAFPGITSILDNFDLFIVGIFIIDLVVIFRQSKSVKDFLVHNWLDLIAVVPIVNFLKIARAVKIIKIFSRAEKSVKASSKLLKANRGAKFFSESSGFNRMISSETKKSKTSKKKSVNKKSQSKPKRKSSKKK
jgi:hypothetical protein